MTILLHKSYLVKVTMMGEGGQKYPKIGPRGLWITPYRGILDWDYQKEH